LYVVAFAASQLTDALPGTPALDRTKMNFWEAAAVRKAVEAADRRKWLLAGLWTTACITFPAIQMLEAGYEIYRPRGFLRHRYPIRAQGSRRACE
jgi:hypothetical protein